MEFEWDEAKAQSNAQKREVTFAEAARVFDDPLQLSVLDPVERDEERWLTLGSPDPASDRIVMVAHTYRRDATGGERIRIISARAATARERRGYEGEAEE
jgi:uncharacterized DUF497 family protein